MRIVRGAVRAGYVAMLCVAIGSCDDSTDSSPATALRFVGSPDDRVAGQPFDVIVELTGTGGRRSDESGRLISIGLSSPGRLSGPVTVTSTGGVAEFGDLVVTTAGDLVRLNASAGSLSATSDAFTVRPAAVSAARSSFLPDSVIFIPGAPVPLEFTFTDAYGNPIANQTVSVTSSLAGTSLTPSSGTTNADGVFEAEFSATTGGNATLSATIGGAALTLAGHLAATEFCAPFSFAVPGNVSGSLPIATCDAVGRPAAVYRFTRPAASGGVAFTANATGFTARVEVKTSLLEQNVAVQPTVAVPTAEWLLPDGSYLYRVSGNSLTAAGSYSITSAAISGTSGTATRFIVRPGTYTGQSLSPTDREFGDGTKYDYFVLFSERSCTITLRSTAFDAFIWIDDAIELDNVDADDNGGGGTDARLTLNRCNDFGNPVGILANSNPGQNGTTPTGPYTLTIEFGPPVASFLAAARVPASVRTDTKVRDLAELVRLRRAGAGRQ